MIKVKLYTSTTCIPCQKVKEPLASVCEDLGLKLDFVWKENDKDNEFGRYQIMSVPTIMVTKDGNPLDSFVGLMTRKELVDKLSRYKV